MILLIPYKITISIKRKLAIIRFENFHVIIRLNSVIKKLYDYWKTFCHFLIKSTFAARLNPSWGHDSNLTAFLLISNNCINLENNYLNITENDIHYLKLIVSGKFLFYKKLLCEFGDYSNCAHALFCLILQLISLMVKYPIRITSFSYFRKFKDNY